MFLSAQVMKVLVRVSENYDRQPIPFLMCMDILLLNMWVKVGSLDIFVVHLAVAAFVLVMVQAYV